MNGHQERVDANSLLGKLAFECARDFPRQSNNLVYGIFALTFAFYAVCIEKCEAQAFVGKYWCLAIPAGVLGTAAWGFFLRRAATREAELLSYIAAPINPDADTTAITAMKAATGQQFTMRAWLIGINALFYCVFVAFLRFATVSTACVH